MTRRRCHGEPGDVRELKRLPLAEALFGEYWSLVSRAELALVEDRKDDAIDDYAEGAALAVANRDRFALDSSNQQLVFLGTLGFRPNITAEAALVIDRAEKQLDALLGARIEAQAEPNHVVVFSGHMIDNPANRGPGKASSSSAKCSMI